MINYIINFSPNLFKQIFLSLFVVEKMFSNTILFFFCNTIETNLAKKNTIETIYFPTLFTLLNFKAFSMAHKQRNKKHCSLYVSATQHITHGSLRVTNPFPHVFLFLLFGIFYSRVIHLLVDTAALLVYSLHKKKKKKNIFKFKIQRKTEQPRNRDDEN